MQYLAEFTNGSTYDTAYGGQHGVTNAGVLSSDEIMAKESKERFFPGLTQANADIQNMINGIANHVYMPTDVIKGGSNIPDDNPMSNGEYNQPQKFEGATTSFTEAVGMFWNNMFGSSDDYFDSMREGNKTIKEVTVKVSDSAVAVCVD